MIIRNFLDDSSEEVLILDDSTYDRNRSKKVELLSRVFDHTNMKYLKVIMGQAIAYFGFNNYSKAIAEG